MALSDSSYARPINVHKSNHRFNSFERLLFASSCRASLGAVTVSWGQLTWVGPWHDWNGIWITQYQDQSIWTVLLRWIKPLWINSCTHYKYWTANFCHIHITIYEWTKHKTSSIFNYIETNKAIDHERSTKDCWNDRRVDRITTYTTTLLIHQTWPSYCHTKSFSVRFLAITVLHTDEWTRERPMARWYWSPTLSHQQQHNVT